MAIAIILTLIRSTFILVLLLTLSQRVTAQRALPLCERMPSLARQDMRRVAEHCLSGYAVVANRANRSVTFINPDTLATTQLRLPRGVEPMYFGLALATSEVWVGDRGNSRLQIYKLRGSSIRRDGFIDIPRGVAHTSFTQDFSVPFPLVWTTCDIDNVTVVHDLTTRRQLAEIPLPRVVRRFSGIPHDISANKDFGFVTYIKTSNNVGYVGSYDATTFEQVSLIRTAADPHVAARDDSMLFIAAQGGEVLLATIPDLTIVARDRDQASPHGTIITFNSKYFYITNIADLGDKAVVAYDASTLERLPCPELDTSNVVPHNLATTLDGSRIFITHSGATSDIVSVFDIGSDGCLIPSSERIVRTGFNPFGMFVLPRANRLGVCRSSLVAVGP